jgi:uncharacterized membrane protein
VLCVDGRCAIYCIVLILILIVIVGDTHLSRIGSETQASKREREGERERERRFIPQTLCVGKHP